MLRPLFSVAPAISKRVHEYVSSWLTINKTNVDPILSNEQMEIYRALEETDGCAFITGKAGTGKTVLLRYFVANTKKSVVVVAPTGIAALSIRGQTIHSLFKMPPGLIDPRQITIDPKTKQLLSHVDAVIIDEISMARADTIDVIDYMLRIAKGSYDPFGGTQIIAFGDVYQLPPVVEKSLRSYFASTYGGPYFFNAKVWKRAKLTTHELQTIFRQSDKAFKAILNMIRDGQTTSEILRTLAERVTAAKEVLENAMTLTGTNGAAEAINLRQLNTLSSRQKTYDAVITGTIPENAYPTNAQLVLKKGAQVVFIKNDPDGRWVNGTIGTIKSLRKHAVKVRCNDKTIEVTPATWEQLTYEYDEDLNTVDQKVTGTFMQLPLKLAWAMTIHKSQGCTYDKVVIEPGDGLFAHGQAYVALSRCRSLGGLYLLRPIGLKDIIIDLAVVEFMRAARSKN